MQKNIIFEENAVELAYENSKAILTDAFMKASHQKYPVEWQVREILQNFVDHNKNDIGTLNGVDFIIKKNLKNNTKEIYIHAPWKIENTTGLVSLNSDKHDKKAMAGGLGIGLKQTVLYFLREFGAKAFTIKSSDWQIDYSIVSKDEILSNLSQEYQHLVKNSWLIAQKNEVIDIGHKCSYSIVVDADNNKVLDAFKEFYNMAPGEKNIYLGEAHYSSTYGSIKILEKNEQGFVYVNGQVFRCDHSSEKTYWGNPGQVTLNFVNIDYAKSLDRSPMQYSEIKPMIKKVLSIAHRNSLLNLLKKSTSIWHNHTEDSYMSKSYNYDFILIEVIVDLLAKNNIKLDGYFEENYLYSNSKASESEMAKAKAQGYIVVAHFFKELGVVSIDNILEDISQIKKSKPKYNKMAYSKLSETGIPVGYKNLKFDNSEDFKTSFLTLLQDNSIALNKINNRTYQLVYDKNDYLIDNILNTQILNPKKYEQKKIYTLRSYLHYGLNETIIENLIITTKSFVYTYAIEIVDEENLLLSKQTHIKNQQQYIHIDIILKDEMKLEIDLPAKSLDNDLQIKRKKEVQEIIDNTVYNEPKQKKETSSQNEQSPSKGISDIVNNLKNEKINTSSTDLKEFNEKQYKATSIDSESINSKYNNANIKGKQKAPSKEEMQLQEVANELAKLTDDNNIEDFSIIPFEKVSEVHIKKLSLLKVFLNHIYDLELTRENTFVFSGNGAKGVNIGNTVGFHIEMLNVDFFELLQTAVHEITHNKIKGHGNNFIRHQGNLFSYMVEKLLDEMDIKQLEKYNPLKAPDIFNKISS